MELFERLMSLEKQQTDAVAANLTEEEIAFLVNVLLDKDDKLRYHALLLLQSRSAGFSDVYPYWQVFLNKLTDDNSYQRSIGLMLLAENARWDTENKMEAALDSFLSLLRDEKPITIRQCIQALHKIIPYKPHLAERIADALISLELANIRETMQKPILTDILGVIAVIRRQQPSEKMNSYIAWALSGVMLDRKVKKEFEKILTQTGESERKPSL